MTREEARQIIISDEWLWDEHSFTTHEIKALELAASALKNPWTSIDEELPKCDVVLFNGTEKAIAEYNREDCWTVRCETSYIANDELIRDRFKYFMPIHQYPL